MENNLNSQSKRIEVVDVLRGVAIMGIILLHTIEHFNFYSFPDTSTQSNFLNFTDKAIWDGMFFLLGGKCYAIFALLFGFSFYIQDHNQQLKGKDFRLRFLWRLFLLFLIGTVNAMFFTAEILVMYAVLGLILGLFCRLPRKTVFIVAVIFLLQPMAWATIIYALLNPEYVSGESLALHYFNNAFKVQSTGTFLETVNMNLWDGQLANFAWAWEHGRIFQTMGLFLMGMLAGRAEIFRYSGRNIKTWKKAFPLALIIYFPLSGLLEILPGFINNKVIMDSFTIILKSLSNLAFMVLIVSAVVVSFYTTRLNQTLLKLVPYGKMSLTNYVSQSVIGSFLFYNWGLGLHDKLGITASLLLGIILFLLQYSFCYWWLKKHTQGPLEYIWKKATWIGKH